MDQVQSSSRTDLGRLTIAWTPALQQHLALASVAIALLMAVFFYMSKQQEGRQRMPPGPRPWPIIGNLDQLSPLAHQDLQRLAKIYGPIFHMKLGSKDTIVVSSPQIAKEIIKTHDSTFASRPPMTQFDLMGYGSQNLIAVPYGAHFRFIKAVFTNELINKKRVQEYEDARKGEVLSTIRSMFDECNEGKPISLNDKLHHLLMNIVTQIVMSKSYFGPAAPDAREAADVTETMAEAVALSAVFVFGDYIPLFKHFDVQGLKKAMRANFKKVDRWFQEILDDHRRALGSEQDREVKDVVDVLLSRSTAENEKTFTDIDIKGILLVGIFAGTTTASLTVAWAMTELLKHPNLLKRAQDELDAVVGRDRLVEEADIPNLPFFRLIVKETYRLHPVSPMLMRHLSMESQEIAGYHIPVNSSVFVNFYAIHRDPEVWDRPLEFDPERFLSTDIDVHGQDFELLPFGAGKRSCPGKNLGLVMVDYILAVLLHACDFSLPPGVRPEDIDLAEAPGLACEKKNPLQVIVSPRLPLDVIFGSRPR